ncbi:uncharacterized protein SEPMUDRAFT_36999 [Sphaerulina musiva SO2202]|uniref:Uncharacterized protein n=1 Tax=Sphaerulina musiva (strain SO2202) TaxID=692275 RepID=M3DCZ1_SPHMS|nr:uncharacterized protein SEPMUDRAFT_36999 [Sphaerulina musiva SO2202]EMF15684.1 hypothetical protein SEPMUDRAFT_36999 [Sphaerulina musiva SO2202]
MPTQRPSLLGGFLSAFRAHQHKTSALNTTSTTAVSGAATIWTAAQPVAMRTPSPGPELAAVSPKPINPKTSPYTAQTTTSHTDCQLVAYPPSLEHNVSPLTHLPRSPPSPGLPTYGPPNKPPPNYPSVQDVRKSRRGSDSSTEGYREVRSGSEKWFIGGLTAGGEERYYKLSMVKRDKSADRISTDQMSL